MPLSLRKLVGIVIACISFLAIGSLVLYGAYETWLHQEMLLTRRRVPRLVTYAANPTEFVLRCMFVGALGGFFFSAACIVVLGFFHRLVALQGSFLTGPFESTMAKLLLLVPLAFFALWFALLMFLPAFYD